MSPNSFRKSIFIGVILLLITAHSFSQNLTDQVLEVNRLSNEKQYDKAIQKCKVLLKTNEIHNFNFFYLQKTLAEIYSNTDTDSSFVHFSIALETLQNEPLSSERHSAELYCNSSLGYIQKLRKKYNSSTQYLGKAVVLFHTQTEPTLADSTEYLYSVNNLSEILHIGDNQNEVNLENEIVRLSEWPNRYSNYIDNIEHNCIASIITQKKTNKKLLNLYKNIFTSTIGYSNVQRIKARHKHSLLSSTMSSELVKELSTFKLNPNDSLDLRIYFKDTEKIFTDKCFTYTHNNIAYNYQPRIPTSENLLSLGINLYYLNSLESCTKDKKAIGRNNEFLSKAKKHLEKTKYDSNTIEILKYICWISNDYSVTKLSQLNGYKKYLTSRSDNISFYNLKSSLEEKNGLINDYKRSLTELNKCYLNKESLTTQDSTDLHFIYHKLANMSNDIEKISNLKQTLKYKVEKSRGSQVSDSLFTYGSIIQAYTSVNDFSNTSHYLNTANQILVRVKDKLSKLRYYRAIALYYSKYKKSKDYVSIIENIKKIECKEDHMIKEKEILIIKYKIDQLKFKSNQKVKVKLLKAKRQVESELKYRTPAEIDREYYFEMQNYYLMTQNDSCIVYLDSLDDLLKTNVEINTKFHQLLLIDAKATYYDKFGYYDNNTTTLQKRLNFTKKEFGPNSEQHLKSLLALHGAYYRDNKNAETWENMENEIGQFSFDMYSSRNIFLINQFLEYKANLIEFEILTNGNTNTKEHIETIKKVSQSKIYVNNKDILPIGLANMITSLFDPKNESIYGDSLFSEYNILYLGSLINDISDVRNREIYQKKFLMSLGIIITNIGSTFNDFQNLHSAIQLFKTYEQIGTYSAKTDLSYNFHFAIAYKYLDSLDQAIYRINKSINAKENENSETWDLLQVPKNNSYLDCKVLFTWLKERGDIPSTDQVRTFLNSNYHNFFKDDTPNRKSILSYNLLNENNDNITSYYLNYNREAIPQHPIDNIQSTLQRNEAIILFDIAYFRQTFVPFVISITDDKLQFSYMEGESNLQSLLNPLFLEDKNQFKVIFSGGALFNNIRSLTNINRDINITYLSSFSSLDSENYAYPIRSNEVVLIGNPKFSNSTIDTNKEFTALDYINSTRGDFENSQWTQLPATENEIQEISNTLSDFNYDIKYFSQLESSEFNFREIEYPEILHIATHGFYKNIDSISIVPGLVLSHANENSNIDPKNKNDGYIFPNDLIDIPLTSTKLVVLSACDSGKRDIYGGHLDFTRMLFDKGVENIIVTLDVIDDNATKDFMTTFYSYMVQLNNIRLAFDKTEDYMKEKYTEPKYWNNFILISKFRESSLF